MKHSIFRKILVVLVSVPLAGLTHFSFSQVSPGSETSNVLLGRIFQEDGKRVAVENGTVRAYNVDSGKVYSTTTIAETGSYLFSGLPDGAYEFTVETPTGNFYAPHVITLSGGIRQKLSFSLSREPLPESVRNRLERRGISDALAEGVANTVTNAKAGGAALPGLAKKTKVTAIIVGSVIGAFTLIEALDDDEGSPF